MTVKSSKDQNSPACGDGGRVHGVLECKECDALYEFSVEEAYYLALRKLWLPSYSFKKF